MNCCRHSSKLIKIIFSSLSKKLQRPTKAVMRKDFSIHWKSIYNSAFILDSPLVTDQADPNASSYLQLTLSKSGGSKTYQQISISYNDQLGQTFEHFLSFPDQPHCASLVQSLILVYCSQVEGPGGPTGADVCVGLGTGAGAGVVFPEGPAQDLDFPDQEHCALLLQDWLSVNTSQSTGTGGGLGDRKGLAVGAGGSVGPVGDNWLIIEASRQRTSVFAERPSVRKKHTLRGPKTVSPSRNGQDGGTVVESDESQLPGVSTKLWRSCQDPSPTVSVYNSS